MKKAIYLFILSTLFLSCKEEESLISPVPNELEYLKFDDINQMDRYFNSIANPTDDTFQKTSVENNSQFESFKEVYYKAMEELDDLESDEQHEKFLQKYSDIIVLRDNTYMPKISNSFYQAICNRDGIYESEGYVHKVIDDNQMIITESKNISALKNINSISGLDSKKFQKVTYNVSSTVPHEGRMATSCGQSSVIKDYFNNNRRCRDDRKVYVKGYVYWITSGRTYIPAASAEAYGMLRNGWCNWKPYKTSLATRNCSFLVSASINGQSTPYSNTQYYSKTFADQSTTSDAYEIQIHYGRLTQSSYFWDQLSTPSIQFMQVNLEATSRGVGNNWVELNCQ